MYLNKFSLGIVGVLMGSVLVIFYAYAHAKGETEIVMSPLHPTTGEESIYLPVLFKSGEETIPPTPSSTATHTPTSTPTPSLTATQTPTLTQTPTNTTTPTLTPTPTLSNWAENYSYCTTCAEEDNVSGLLFAQTISSYQIIATHPTYEVGVDNCDADFSGCGLFQNQPVSTEDTCTTILDDGTNVVQGCLVEAWWRPYMMTITVGASSDGYHYLRLYRKISDENSWPQYLVLYEDGYLRLKPHPLAGTSDNCFGSSVIIGPAVDIFTQRPYVDIQEVEVVLVPLSLDLTYRDGGTAHISLSVDRVETIAQVDVFYPSTATNPFAIFRSMFVAIGNADADHIQNPIGSHPVEDGWSILEGPWWFFYRESWSQHNTSAPDIRIEITAP